MKDKQRALAHESLDLSLRLMRENKDKFIAALCKGVREVLEGEWEYINTTVGQIGHDFVNEEEFFAFLERGGGSEPLRDAVSAGFFSFAASFDRVLAARFSDRIPTRALAHMEWERKECTLPFLTAMLEKADGDGAYVAATTPDAAPEEADAEIPKKRPKLRRKKREKPSCP
jgi:hypothetical protein